MRTLSPYAFTVNVQRNAEGANGLWKQVFKYTRN